MSEISSTVFAMLVLSNQRLGPWAELLLSRANGAALLREVADAARSRATAHWEHELVRWLDEQSVWIASTNSHHLEIDVGDIAFTPQHFDRQRRFLLDAIEDACSSSTHARALVAWLDMLKAHPRDSVQIGRRWTWHSTG